MNKSAVIAANRFGLGARPGELSAIGADPRGWLRAQIGSESDQPEPVATLPKSAQIFRVQAEALRARRDVLRASQQADQQDDATRRDAAIKAAAAEVRDMVREHYLGQVAARYLMATRTAQPFRERLVHFWSNHFAVSMDKPIVAALAGTLENEAIRANLHRSFYELLLAAESHPAMILYLDNQASTGPNSPLADLIKRRGERNPNPQRKIDINENLGREILELHTLGVTGGYTQADVTNFAKALTGWSIGGDPAGSAGGAAARLGIAARIDQGEPGEFVFREGLHEPGTQTILGKRYAEAGIEQPRAVLKDLARHPSTASFIATKLARHFIADELPADAVEEIARVFRDTDGDLPSVHAAVIDCEAAWHDKAVKLKTPHEFVVSTFRAFDFLPEKPQQILAPFELLGQRPYSPGSPAGWADIAGQWDGPDALMKRIEWATQVGQRVGTRFDPMQLAEASLGDSLTEHTRMAIRGAADAGQGTVLWMMSPEFQRR